MSLFMYFYLNPSAYKQLTVLSIDITINESTLKLFEVILNFSSHCYFDLKNLTYEKYM
jgi:hypothetical protein